MNLSLYTFNGLLFSLLVYFVRFPSGFFGTEYFFLSLSFLIPSQSWFRGGFNI